MTKIKGGLDTGMGFISLSGTGGFPFRQFLT